MNGTAEVLTDTKESGLNPSLFSPKGTPALSHPGGCYTLSAYGVLLSALCAHYCSSCISSIPPTHTHTWHWFYILRSHWCAESPQGVMGKEAWSQCTPAPGRHSLLCVFHRQELFQGTARLQDWEVCTSLRQGTETKEDSLLPPWPCLSRRQVQSLANSLRSVS